MSPLPATYEEATQKLRFMHVAFIANVFVFPLIAEFVGAASSPPLREVYWAVAALAVAEVGVIFYLRTKVGAAESLLRTNREDGAALQEWYRWQIVLFALSESLILLGFLVRFLGLPLASAAPFYAAGLIMLLLNTPRKLD